MPQGSPPPSSVVIRVHTHLAFRMGENGPKTWPEILGLRGKVMGARHSLGHPRQLQEHRTVCFSGLAARPLLQVVGGGRWVFSGPQTVTRSCCPWLVACRALPRGHTSHLSESGQTDVRCPQITCGFALQKAKTQNPLRSFRHRKERCRPTAMPS